MLVIPCVVRILPPPPPYTHRLSSFHLLLLILLPGLFATACSNPAGGQTTYTITFDSYYSSAVVPAPITAPAGTAVPRPANPTRDDDSNFQGWYSEESGGTLYAWPHSLTENVTMYAQWYVRFGDEEYTITFDSHGGSEVESVTTWRQTITRPANPTRAGYDFTGWYSAENGGTEYKVWPYALEGNVTMHAQWEVRPLSGQYTVTFHHLGGSPAPRRQAVTAGGRANEPSPMTKAPEGLFTDTVDPASVTFAFSGWYTDAGYTVPWDSGAPVTKNLNIYAKWTAPFPFVDLSAQPGDSVLAQSLAYIAAQPRSPLTNYTIVLAGGAYTLPGLVSDQANINTRNVVITLAGKTPAEISLSSSGSLFHITDGGLILGNNIALKGRDLNGYHLVIVDGYSASLTMKTGAKISGNANHAGTYGGDGVSVGNEYVSAGGSFTMEGGEISGNSSTGVIVKENSNFIMNSGKISGNSGGVIVRGSFTMSGGEISGNTEPYGGGGSVSVYDGGSFTMGGGEITGNLDDGVSVGLGNHVGSFTMEGGEISGNSGYGVIISSNNNNSSFTMKAGAKITGNSEGGVSVGDSFTMEGGEISGNTSNRSSNGGGVNVSGSGSSFTMSGGVISGNTAIRGGGVYVDGSFTMRGGVISDNSASFYSGGGVAVSSRGSFTMKTGAKISGNTASNGGGVYVWGNFAMEGGEISSNIASGGNANYQGGGVYIYYSGSFTMSGGKISGNTASNGGGVYVYYGSTFTMIGGEISGNTASGTGTDSGGGGVYVDRVYLSYTSGSFALNGGVISANTAANGGGVYVYTSSTFTMTGGKISGNTASGTETGFGGGGVYISNGKFEITGGEISGNTSNSGGGVYVINITGNSGNGSFNKTGGGVICGSNETTASLKNIANSGDTWGHAIQYIISTGSGSGASTTAYYRDTTLNTGDNISAETLPESGTGHNWTKK